MVAQYLNNDTKVYKLLDYIDNKIKQEKKRARAKYPSYVKFYTVYEYDKNKFKALLKDYFFKDSKAKKAHLLRNLNPYELLNQCYIRDSKGHKIREVDEEHIFRIKTLYKLYEEIGYVVFKGQMKLDLEENY